MYDWTLNPSGLNEPSFKIPSDVERRLLIERFCNRVTKALYSNRLDPVGLMDDAQRSVLTAFLARDFEDLEERLATEMSCMSVINLAGSFYVILLELSQHSTPIPSEAPFNEVTFFFKCLLKNPRFSEVS